MNIAFEKVLHAALVTQGKPVVTAYELFRLMWEIYTRPDRHPAKFTRRVRTPGYVQYRRVIKSLGKDRFIRADEDFETSDQPRVSTRTRVFRVSDVSDASGEEIACLVDPFCYISHLSALQQYGLTARQPQLLIMSTPDSSIWRTLRREKMIADYGFDPTDRESPEIFRSLQQISLPQRLRSRKIELHRISKNYPVQKIADRFTRIIEVGNLFAQSIDEPTLCGGMPHVIEIWDEYAEIYLEPIIAAIDKAPALITKVRAGYLLEERLGIHDSRIVAWKAFAQRGGSRKLDPTAPYAPTFSESWMLSINV